MSTSSQIIEEAERARQLAQQVIRRVSASAAATTGGTQPPNQGGAHASPVVTAGQQPSTGGGGGGNTPTPPGGGGGSGGNSGSSGGFDAWFRKLSFPQAVGVCLLSFLLVSLTLHAISTWNNERVDRSEAVLSLNSAQTALEVSRIKEQTVALQKKTTKTSSSSANVLRTVEYSTFDCRAGKLEQGFATAQTVVAEKGTQLLVKGGCVKLRFNHEVTTLQGEGYLIAFELLSNPGAELFGKGKMGRFDSPQEVMDRINANLGRDIYVSMDNYLRIGG